MPSPRGLILALPFLFVAGALAGQPEQRLRVASLSIVPEKWNKEANAREVERRVREAAAGAKLIVTPEGVLEGYVVNEVIREKDASKKVALIERFQRLAEPIDGPYIRRFQALADELDVWLIIGFLERAGEALYNSAILISPEGRIAGNYHKSHLHQGYDVNPPGYTPGTEYPVFDLGFARLGILICFDRQPPEPAQALALNGADIIMCPAFGSWGEWNTRLMQVRAYENQVHVIFTNPHHSLIIDPDGELLGESHRDSVLIRDLDLSRPTRSRPSITRRRPETYGALVKK